MKSLKVLFDELNATTYATDKWDKGVGIVLAAAAIVGILSPWGGVFAG